eukprot:11286255-Prorocentrum_lima.AAC.1
MAWVSLHVWQFLQIGVTASMLVGRWLTVSEGGCGFEGDGRAADGEEARSACWGGLFPGKGVTGLAEWDYGA